MVLSIGTMPGPYKNTGAIGAGRMGKVYHVCDDRNDSSFAIKVLQFNVSAYPSGPLAASNEMTRL
jgi:hypothetical protein